MSIILKIINRLYRARYLHFVFTGGIGVAINLFTAWFLVAFILTEEKYLLFTFSLKETTIGIIAGQTLNLLYNFIFYSLFIFKTTEKHKRRFVVFVIYSLVTSYLVVTPLIVKLRDFLEQVMANVSFFSLLKGHYYIVASIVVIFLISIFNFFFFKKWLFRQK